MGDPRNVAHAKKGTQEKHHKAKHAQKAAAPKAAEKAQIDETNSAAAQHGTASKFDAEKPPRSTRNRLPFSPSLRSWNFIRGQRFGSYWSSS
jgi:hypothetical protein